MATEPGNAHLWPSLLDRLVQAASDGQFGWLIGAMAPDGLTIFSAVRGSNGSGKYFEEEALVREHGEGTAASPNHHCQIFCDIHSSSA
jgi:hypothetical protein